MLKQLQEILENTIPLRKRLLPPDRHTEEKSKC